MSKHKVTPNQLQVGDRIVARLGNDGREFEVERWTSADARGAAIPATGPSRIPRSDLLTD